MSERSSEVDRAKHELRAAMRERLALIPDGERARQSIATCNAVIASLAFHRARTVMLFLAIAIDDQRIELDPRGAAKQTLVQGKSLALPRIDWDERRLHPVLLDDLDPPTQVLRHGVPEPMGGQEIDPAEIDLVIVPGLAFDASGARLGRGAGFYDRFLAGWRRARGPRGGLTMGVGFAEQIVEAVPFGAHDVRMDAVATETGLFSTARGIL